MKPLMIIGAGGFAREVYAAIMAINRINNHHDVLGFVDLELDDRIIIQGKKVVLTEAALAEYHSPLDVVIALTDCGKRADIAQGLINNSMLSFPPIIHPSAVFMQDQVSFGRGCYVAAGTVLSPGVNLEDFTVVNLLASLAHDVQVGRYSVINPHANISGSVTISESVLIGASAVVHQGLELAQGSVLGMGAVLTRSTTAKASYFGNPARKIMENG